MGGELNYDSAFIDAWEVKIMSEKLQEVIQCIRDSDNLSSTNEMGVRQAVILPVLDALGWKVWNISEVIPEYTVGQNRVDYCLAIHEASKVFIEAKAAREDLDIHREQLLKYAFQNGVPLAVLTNGLKWSFYLPLREGAWHKRHFLDIDLYSESLTEIDRKLENFLSRSSVSSGVAMTEAAKVYEGAQKADMIERALPKAWNKIIQQPDELLVELLVETVEDICGHRPDKKRIEEFVANLPSFSTQESDETKRPPMDAKPPVPPGVLESFPASVPRAFLAYGALSVKSRYRTLLPANQEGLAPKDRTYFIVNFPGYGEVKAYMSQGRLKIKDKGVWREILTKLGIRPDDTFMVKIIKPSKYYEANRQ